MTIKNATIALAALLGVAAAGHAGDGTTTTTFDFEDGVQGWIGPQGPGGESTWEATGGNPDGHFYVNFNDFGITVDNASHPVCSQDFSVFESVTISMDLKVEDISFLGLPYQRPWVLEIRDYDNPPAGYPWVSVFYLFDWVGNGGWTTWSVTIDDPASLELPAGWGGTGAEDPDTFMPILPKGRTFASVLEGADEIAYTTFLPGYFFSNVQFELRIDNITIETVEGGTPIEGDANGDGVVDVQDMVEVITTWGDCEGCPADFDGNGVVDVEDLVTVITNWSS